MFDEKNGSIEKQGRRLSAAFASAEASEQTSRRPSRMKLSLAVGGATVAVALVAVAVFGGVRSDGAFTLEDAVAAVTQAAFDMPREEPDKFLYMKYSDLQTGVPENASAEYEPFVVESWTREGDPTYWSRVTVESADRTKKFAATCENKVIKTHTPSDSASLLGLPKGESFPSNADELYRKLLGDQDDDPDGLYNAEDKVWDEIGMAMQGGAKMFSAEQRAVLMGTLAKVPGATTLGRIKDPNGNETIAFERINRGARQRIYFDAHTSLTTYMSKTVITPNEKWFPGMKAGDRVFGYALLDFRYIDALPGLKAASPGKVDMGDHIFDFGKC